MSINMNNHNIGALQENIEEISEDIEEISEGIEEIQKDEDEEEENDIDSDDESIYEDTNPDINDDKISLFDEDELKEKTIVPFQPEKSSFYTDLLKDANGDVDMPKNGSPLSDSEVNLVKQWILDGALE